jgi:modulator of FtsH protease
MNEANGLRQDSNKSKELIRTKVLPGFFMTLFISFAGTILGSWFIPENIALAIGVIPLIVLVLLLIKSFFATNKRRSGISTYGMQFPMVVVHLFSLFIGIGIYPLMNYYMDSMGSFLVVLSFAITVVLFGSLFAYTYFTKRDFSFLGGILFFSLLALILVGIMALFIGSNILQFALAWIGVVVFSGYILYDVSRMKKSYFTEADVPAAVFDLFLNFINLFLDILRIINYIKK